MSDDLPALPGEITPVYYRPAAMMNMDEWLSKVELAKTLERGINWWLGDLLVFGQDKFGEAYAQAYEGSEDHLLTMASVSRRFPPERRWATLSWSHHQIVCTLTDAQQDYWLARCSEEGLSTHQLRACKRAEGIDPVNRTTPQLMRMFKNLPQRAEQLYYNAGGVWSDDVEIETEEGPVTVSLRVAVRRPVRSQSDE